MSDSTHVVELDDGNFGSEIGTSEGISVVDFWAPWCGPCRTVAPVIEELAEEYDGEVRFVKVNIDEAPVTAGMYGVRSIPTIGFFVDGEAVGAVVGAYPKEALRQVIEQVRSGEIQAA